MVDHHVSFYLRLGTITYVYIRQEYFWTGFATRGRFTNHGTFSCYALVWLPILLRCIPILRLIFVLFTLFAVLSLDLAAKFLSLLHSVHAILTLQSFAKWSQEAIQRKHTRFCLSFFVFSSRGLARKALHLLSGCGLCWTIHQFAGLRGGGLRPFAWCSNSTSVFFKLISSFRLVFRGPMFLLSGKSMVRFGSFLSRADSWMNWMWKIR